jgi:arabinose-5-phosphate isomerase
LYKYFYPLKANHIGKLFIGGDVVLNNSQRRNLTIKKPENLFSYTESKGITKLKIVPKKQIKIKDNNYLPLVQHVIEFEGRAILNQVSQVTSAVNEAIKLILDCNGRVVVTGIGKSGIIGRKITATLASTGTPSLYLHPAEGVHGDLGMVREGDVVLAISNSGETSEILQILPTLKEIGVSIISIVNNEQSSLAKASNVVLRYGKVEEAGALGLAPTTSTTVTLVLGDALALALSRARNFGPEDFALYHPSGTLGRKLLLTVGELVERRSKNPIVSENDSVRDAIFIMTKQGVGAVSVVDNQMRFVGILTDGGIRRAFSTSDDVLKFQVSELCNREPVTIKYDVLASEVLTIMKEKKVRVIPVLDDLNHPISMIEIQSLIELGL